MNDIKNAKLTFESENLAVPEIHTGEVDTDEDDELLDEDKGIAFDNLAIPEIHLHKKKN